MATESELKAQIGTLQRDLAVFRSLADNSKDGIVLFDTQLNYFIYANKTAHEMLGRDYASQEMLGLRAIDLWPADNLKMLQEVVSPAAMSDGWRGEVPSKRKDGSPFIAALTIFPVTDAEGNVMHLAAVLRDVTEQKQAEAERERLQQQIIEAQKRAIQELSTPIIPVMDQVIVMPLIGSIDTLRSKEVMRALLNGISEYRARVVILDITGVPIVDSGVASHLNKTIQAARLKGAHTIVTGISDAVAETVVELGLDWSGIETLDNLQTGLLTALGRLGIRLSKVG